MAKRIKSTDDGIELSPKHGLNPMLTTCFWCGEGIGVAFVGRLRKTGDSDAEAPRRSCLDLEPCDKCRRRFAKGMLAIEVTEDGSKFGNNRRFSFGAKDSHKRMWPTGRWAVIRPEAVKDGKPGGKFLCDSTVMDMILAAKNRDGDDGEHSEGCGKERQ